MSHPVGSHVRNRIEVAFVEADVEIGFNLVDMAETERGRGNPFLAARVLEDAEDVFHDIQRRLDRLGVVERGHFEALVGELRREIDQAKAHNSSGDGGASLPS
jgi:hypothetical protein